MIYLTNTDFAGRYRLSGDPSIQSQQADAIRQAERELLQTLLGLQAAARLEAGGYDPVFGGLLRLGYPFFILPYPQYAVPFVFHRYADFVLGHNRTDPLKKMHEAAGSVYRVAKGIELMGMNWRGRTLGYISSTPTNAYLHDANQLSYTAFGYRMLTPPPFVGARVLVGGVEDEVVSITQLSPTTFQVFVSNSYSGGEPVSCVELLKAYLPL